MWILVLAIKPENGIVFKYIWTMFILDVLKVKIADGRISTKLLMVIELLMALTVLSGF